MSPSRRPSLSDFFEDLDDPRKPGRNFRHPLINVLVTAVVGMACGQKTFTAIADFIDGQRAWFERFLDLSEGVPCADTYRRVFEAIDPLAFEQCFRRWAASLSELLLGETIAVDGKTIRNSNKPGERAIHLVSAWATASGLLLGQLATNEKSNEITAIPELLESLALGGCLVTIDAMGCQKAIARKIVDGRADSLLSLKDNHRSFHDDVKEYFRAFRSGELTDERMSVCEQADKGHGRLEVRRCFTTPNGRACAASRASRLSAPSEARRPSKRGTSSARFPAIRPSVFSTAIALTGAWKIACIGASTSPSVKTRPTCDCAASRRISRSPGAWPSTPCAASPPSRETLPRPAEGPPSTSPLAMR